MDHNRNDCCAARALLMVAAKNPQAFPSIDG